MSVSAKESFVARLKIAAQDVMDHAEDIVGDHDLLTEVKVTITVPTLDDGVYEPDIKVSRSFYSDGIRARVWEEIERG